MREIKILAMFLSVYVFTACSEYTVTNKTETEIRLEKSGGDIIELPAGECKTLTEFFLGLGGDFPFVLLVKLADEEGEKQEHSPGNYEITKATAEATSGATTGEIPSSTASSESEDGASSGAELSNPIFDITLSQKNPECSDSDKEQESSSSSGFSPLCSDGKQAKCEDGLAKCLAGDTTNDTATEEGQDSEKLPFCVTNKGNKLSIKPKCEGVSGAPTCRRKSLSGGGVGEWTQESEEHPACVSGRPVCDVGTIICIREKGKAGVYPSCVQNDKIVANFVLSCEGGDTANQAPKCMSSPPVKINPDSNTPCRGETAQCPDGATPVCGLGSAIGDRALKPYCVDKGGYRWPGSVTCSGGSEPECGVAL